MGLGTMDVVEAIHSRRSVRAYTSRPVERALIEALVWDAAQAPPPFAGQVPWTFNAIEGVARIAAFGERAKRYAAEHAPDGEVPPWTTRDDFKVFWDAPAVVIISGRSEDCCRAGQLLILSAHARGLGACWVGAPMAWLQSTAVMKEIGIPDGLTPVSAICIGYPAAVPAPQKRSRPTVLWLD